MSDTPADERNPMAITCTTCQDVGWVTAPEHAPSCNGEGCDPELCPVPVQVPCGDCQELPTVVPVPDWEDPF